MSDVLTLISSFIALITVGNLGFIFHLFVVALFIGLLVLLVSARSLACLYCLSSILDVSSRG